jgi:hypothetical protein
MWNKNLRPYGEYFALDQAITSTQAVGNVSANIPTRIDASQGGTAIVCATTKTGTLAVGSTNTVTLKVLGAKTATAEDSDYVELGTATFTNDSGGSLTLGSDTKVCECIIGDALLKYPYVKITIGGNAAATGKVDVFPAYVSHNGR